MSSLISSNNEMSVKHVEIPIHSDHIETKPSQNTQENNIDYSQMAQWLQKAKDGLVSVTSLMICVGVLNEDITIMLLAGSIGLVAGACTMAVGEFVFVYTQLDIEVALIRREREFNCNKENELKEEDKFPNPFGAAIASAVAFSAGAVVPLLAAAFIRDYKIRLVIVVAVASLALLVFVGVGAVVGKSKTPVRRTCGQNAEWRLNGYAYYFWI
ncbi:hypothetical protein RJT34_04099 [Clitoria ternatea]|uniref:Vacuolar iron transporter n=1 Tax=Clitoria ternatea TaxID=43366 RepID=A0AAN9KNG8_CLITE